jgi:hypothetical protein
LHGLAHLLNILRAAGRQAPADRRLFCTAISTKRFLDTSVWFDPGIHFNNPFASTQDVDPGIFQFIGRKMACSLLPDVNMLDNHILDPFPFDFCPHQCQWGLSRKMVIILHGGISCFMIASYYYRNTAFLTFLSIHPALILRKK